jgi:hypothetical protein
LAPWPVKKHIDALNVPPNEPYWSESRRRGIQVTAAQENTHVLRIANGGLVDG